MNRIRELRVAKGLKQADLAKMLNCQPTTISNYELSIRDIDSETINRLCDLFGCSADFLIGRSPIQSPAMTPEEQALLLAWRAADQRARDMVTLALEPFRQEAATDQAI